MIGVLNAYHWDGDPNSYQTKYAPMARDFLEKHFSEKQVRFYEIPKSDRPASPADCDFWLITGSAKSVYEDVEWIDWLKQFTKECHAQKAKVIGLCFGHQLVAEALGGEVKKSDKGWGVGVRQFQILSQKPWMTPALDKASLIYSHQDQVMRLPEGAEALGSSEFCEHEAFQVGNHFLCFQGHPEFTADYAVGRYEARKNIIGEPTFTTALDSMSGNIDDATIWAWIKNFVQQP